MQTLHIATLDKFIPPIINLIRKIETKNKQFFYTYGDIKKYPYEMSSDSIHVNRTRSKVSSFVVRYFPLLVKMYKADKIILHGLSDIYLIFVLSLNPWLLKKCYWLVWGGDLYCFDNDIVKNTKKKRIVEFFRRVVIKKIGYIVTYIDGDYDLAKKWYYTKAKHIECFMYLSNIPQKYGFTKKESKLIAVQVGNSSDPTNNHFEILNSLAIYNGNIKVYIPLSYGDEAYAEEVKKYAEKLFGENVSILNSFLPYEEYISFLNEIDIAVFNHKRQQAMGNTIMLLGLGKTVFIRSDTTQWDLLTGKYGLALKDTKKLDLLLLSDEQEKNNIRHINEIFTVDELIRQYECFL